MKRENNVEVPFVSVCLITYNHFKYINQAVESVMMQQATFSWELIIADDFSTDGTREVILELKNKYPDAIRLILQEKNVGPGRNWLDLLFAAKSKYIAYFEGDDYWIDPLKLQKQVDFLEANLSYQLCAHNASVLDEKSGKIIDVRPNYKEQQDINMDTLIEANPFLTASYVFRREILTGLPSWFINLPFGDYGLLVLCISKGKIGCLKDVMSVYRIHSDSVHAQLFTSQKGTIKAINRHLLFWNILLHNLFKKTKYELAIQKKIISLYQRQVRLHLNERHWIKLAEVKIKVIILQFLLKIKLKTA